MSNMPPIPPLEAVADPEVKALTDALEQMRQQEPAAFAALYLVITLHATQPERSFAATCRTLAGAVLLPDTRCALEEIFASLSR